MTEPSFNQQLGAGAMLRAAREKQGLHIAALAAAIKVAPRKLDALENDRWHELPDATFTRALAQTVCRSLKIDPRPVLELLPPAESALLDGQSGNLNEPFSERPSRDEAAWSGLAVKPMYVAAALLMLAAAAVYFAPAGWWPGGGAAQQPALAPAPPVAPVLAAAPAASAPMVAGAASAASLAASAVAAGAASAPAQTPVAQAASAAEPRVETVFAAPPVAAASAPASSGALQLRTGEASWIEVRDARGRVLLSRNVLPGEAVGLDGEAPLRLVVGNAAATQISFRGQAVALDNRGVGNVARLELK
jgi:cytoskeleton protein RodZ